MGKNAVLLYSGGSDSTAAAVLLARDYDRVHLVTYSRLGIGDVSRSGANVRRLEKRLGTEKFEHHFLDIEKLYKHIAYDKYFRNLLKHGYFMLSTCGFCKLAMHARSILLAREVGSNSVSDGANASNYLLPAQMEGVIGELKRFYKHFGIAYENPVYRLEDDKCYITKGYIKEAARLLHSEGILSDDEVEQIRNDYLKYDDKIQARCSDVMLFDLFSAFYYVPRHGYRKYETRTRDFYHIKVDELIGEIEEYLNDPGGSVLNKYL